MATTDCQLVACKNDRSGLKLCRECTKENETNFFQNVEKQVKKDAENHKKIGTQKQIEASVKQAKTEYDGS